MSDDPNRQDAEHELDVDLSAFLPEGSRFATDDDELDETAATGLDADAADLDDGWDTGAPAPEIPDWARDDLPPGPVTDRPVATPDDAAVSDAAPATETDAGPAPVPDAGPAVPTVPEVDTTVLSRIEGELADVDAAIAAIDAGDLARSPLLAELLATDTAPADAAPVDGASLDARSPGPQSPNGHPN